MGTHKELVKYRLKSIPGYRPAYATNEKVSVGHTVARQALTGSATDSSRD